MKKKVRRSGEAAKHDRGRTTRVYIIRREAFLHVQSSSYMYIVGAGLLLYMLTCSR